MRGDLVEYNGWKRNLRLANGEVELIVTLDVGPRIIRLGFSGERNLFGELPGQQGGVGENEWMIRGGHRLWVAPEEKPRTYEPDNGPVHGGTIENGIRTRQPAGPLSGIAKSMEIVLSPRRNVVRIDHTLTNRGTEPVTLAPWALTVMAPRGTAIIPLPARIAHADRLTHNQEWSLWGYTNLGDPRWTLGSRYLRFRQDPERSANKLGIAHREGWAAYSLDGFLFVKRFEREDGAPYPDGGVNFETFANEDILELESLGPLVTLAPGESTGHTERWGLFRGVPECGSEADIDRQVLPLTNF